MHTATPSCSAGSWNLNSDPYAQTAGTLPTEMSPWSPYNVPLNGCLNHPTFFCFFFDTFFCIKKKSIIIITNYKGLENEWITSAWEADTLNNINVIIQAHSSISHFLSC